jgi:hypothetical protein
MNREMCKECPWANHSENNDRFIGYAKKNNKTHNCHMIKPSKRSRLWNTKPEYICIGCSDWFDKNKPNVDLIHNDDLM